ncbi:hypothetical protein Pla100_34070 [Neorhodopirellula pilleata]|uniref:Uncharacterized protein n=1 Tax=Neorhodopirellula pilleata TaxID=2714738 RepID=A0A5C6A8V9_9BACT|nr:hypothetical protein Pla100_34070 [Neorhodopirellula pilleata]
MIELRAVTSEATWLRLRVVGSVFPDATQGTIFVRLADDLRTTTRGGVDRINYLLVAWKTAVAESLSKLQFTACHRGYPPTVLVGFRILAPLQADARFTILRSSTRGMSPDSRPHTKSSTHQS